MPPATARAEHNADHQEETTAARLQVLRGIRARSAHLVRALVVARDAEAWDRVAELADALTGTALVGELLAAEVAEDRPRIWELACRFVGRARRVA